MTHHHSPFLLLLKVSPRVAAIGITLFVLFNPVTLAIVIGLLDYFAGSNIGGWFAGPMPVVQGTTQHGTTKQDRLPIVLPRELEGICTVYINGHKHVLATDCKNIVFPGKKVAT